MSALVVMGLALGTWIAVIGWAGSLVEVLFWTLMALGAWWFLTDTENK